MSSEDQILTAAALYQWAKKDLVKTRVFFNPKENHTTNTEEFESRFASTEIVYRIQKYSFFVSTSKLSLMLKKYSLLFS